MSAVKLNLLPLEAREVPAVFVVTTNVDDAATAGSLRWAVAQANANPGLDYINFNLPFEKTLIQLTGSGLRITDQIVIDGRTTSGEEVGPVTIIGTRQSESPSLSTTTLISLTRDLLTERTSSGSTIRGLKLSHAGDAIISIESGSNGNWILNNVIGYYLDAAGTRRETKQVFTPGTPRFPMFGIYYPFGVRVVDSNQNVIRQNRLEGTFFGVTFNGVSIGNDVSMNAIERQEIDGILVRGQAQYNWFGYNLISNNGRNGISMSGSQVRGNLAFKNAIGLDWTCSTASGNGSGSTLVIESGNGVYLAGGATGNAIGHPNHGGNWISANKGGGVTLGLTQSALIFGQVFLSYFSGVEGGPASGNWVENNVIGFNWNQTAIVGVQNQGIVVSGSWYTTIRGNAIGGHPQHGILMGARDFNNTNPEKTESSVVTGNWIGVNVAGVDFVNGGFGIVAMPGANYNYLAGNALRPNWLGPSFIDPNTVGNVI
jgi:hypothetical protein